MKITAEKIDSVLSELTEKIKDYFKPKPIKTIIVTVHRLGWQCCPKCLGTGLVWTPTGQPYNATFSSNGTPFECDVCYGEKIISIQTGCPPDIATFNKS